MVFLGTSKKILRKIEKNQINQLELKTQIKQFGLLLCQPLTNIDLIPLKENLHYYRGKNFSGQHLGVFLISRAIFSFASSGHPVLKKLKEEGTETSERQPTMILTKKIEILKTEICVLKKKTVRIQFEEAVILDQTVSGYVMLRCSPGGVVG